MNKYEIARTWSRKILGERKSKKTLNPSPNDPQTNIRIPAFILQSSSIFRQIHHLNYDRTLFLSKLLLLFAQPQNIKTQA
ncbi:MAG: hypothetical protein WCQ95_06270 [Bacteroidota bacterium]